jgi:hypothetical protein
MNKWCVYVFDVTKSRINLCRAPKHYRLTVKVEAQWQAYTLNNTFVDIEKI